MRWDKFFEVAVCTLLYRQTLGLGFRLSGRSYSRQLTSQRLSGVTFPRDRILIAIVGITVNCRLRSAKVKQEDSPIDHFKSSVPDAVALKMYELAKLVEGLDQALSTLMNYETSKYCREHYLQNFTLEQFETNLIRILNV